MRCSFFSLMALSQDWRPLRRPMAASSPKREAERVRYVNIVLNSSTKTVQSAETYPSQG